MKKIVLLILILVSVTINSQEYKFGKVSKAELEEQVYPLDSSANAAFLIKKRNTYFDYSSSTGIQLISEYYVRLKIYNKEGFDWATKSIFLSTNSSGKEKILALKAVTYNLVSGKIEETKLNKKDIFRDSKDKYTNVTKFTMPNLKEGCILEWRYRIVSPFFSSIDDVVIQYPIPVKNYEGKVSVLEYFTVNKRTKGYLPIEINLERRINTSMGTNDDNYIIKATNVPAMLKEAYVSNIDNYRAGLVFEVVSVVVPGSVYEDYASTWEDVAKTINESSNFGDQLSKGKFLEEEINLLKQNATTNTQKIKAALDFTKSKIKWNKYNGKYTDEGIKNAYKKGTGNVSDINLFLVIVLREIGLSANPILVSTRSNGIPLMPTLDGFNYVVAGVELEGQVVLLDATEKYSAPNVLPKRAINWQGTLVRPSGSFNWVQMASVKPSEINSNISFSLNEEGEIEGISRTQYSNYFGMNYRNNYNALSEEDLISKIEEDNNGIEIETIRITNKENSYKPIVETFKFSSEDLTTSAGDKIYLKPLVFNSITKNPFKLEKRDYPVDFSTISKTKYLASIQLPEGYAVESIPESLAIGLPEELGSYKFRVIDKGDRIEIFSEMATNSVIYPAQYYQELKEFYKNIVKKNAEQIVLKKI
ncbi:hypothetical protein R3X25_10800 [Lutibacter sp. TH_r2]|uniref:hypothetical protein n=1 Tax=Lutibacter sp. TH_r2 TaxID=3082083 RepID=UPI0029539518|nr:hypothetical protein [Lutibacter sp. TH_r2]MDV7187770.1 hypothetical protein [Lutibacter sp. TH_r2]